VSYRKAKKLTSGLRRMRLDARHGEGWRYGALARPDAPSGAE
jgi:hypothetical protein